MNIAIKESITHALAQNQSHHLIVAYSGGLDSHVLLHATKQFIDEFNGTDNSHSSKIKLTALHINHQLSANANLWAAHCELICKALNVPITILKVDASAQPGESPEAAARDARYQAFAAHATGIIETQQTKTVFLLAHHQDDQAETVLLQLLRGAGPAGLAAMPHSQTKQIKHPGCHEPVGLTILRPLLNCMRAELKTYAQQHKLKWHEDESNQNEKFDRNFIRHTIMPQIKTRWPSAASTLARSAEHCANMAATHNAFTCADHRAALTVEGHLSCAVLRALGEQKTYAVLRAHIQKLKLPTPHQRHLQSVWQMLIHARGDAEPLVTWSSVEVRRYRDTLFVMLPISAMPITQTLKWADPSKPLVLPDKLGTLYCRGFVASDSTQSFEVCFRQGGERVQLPGRSHTHALKKLLQDWGVPPWLRARLPLIKQADDIIAMPGYFTSMAGVSFELS